MCRLVSINRTFKSYQSSKLEKDATITDRLSELAVLHIRYGYKRLHILLLREGFQINHKKTYRLYKQAGLYVRKRKKKCPFEKRGKPNTVEIPNLRWSFDFVSDTLTNGRKFRVLTVIYEATCECLVLETDTFLSGTRVVDVLNRIAFFRRFPQEILTYNGSEFTNCALSKWSYDKKIQHIFIKPGKPSKNEFTESRNGKFCEECMDSH